MINRKIINTIKKEILKNKEGLTIDFKGNIQNKEGGFYVSITDNKTELNNLNKSLYDLFKFKELFKNLQDNIFIGCWIDENNLFMDLSLYIEDENTAINTAKQFNQKAIFNIKDLQTIYL